MMRSQQYYLMKPTLTDFKVQDKKETKIGNQFLSVKKLEGKRAPDNKIFELH